MIPRTSYDCLDTQLSLAAGPFDTACKNTETCLTDVFPSVAMVKEVGTHDIITSRTGFEPRKQESSYRQQWKERKCEDYRPPGGPDLEPAVRKEGGGFEPQKPSSSARGWDEEASWPRRDRRWGDDDRHWRKRRGWLGFEPFRDLRL